MASFWTPVRVGLVVAAAAAAFGLGLYFIGAHLGGDKSYRVYAMFDDATGLGARSRVQIAGIPVGQVDRIDLDQTTSQARVWLRIRRDYVLHRDASISKRSESILGDFLLDLTPGSANQPPLKDGDEIRNVLRQPGMNEIFQSLSRITGDIQDITSNLRKVLGTAQGEDNLRAIIENLRSITTNLDQVITRSSGKLDSILTNVQAFTGDLRKFGSGGRDDALAILRNTRQATAEMRDVLSGIGKLIGTQPGGGGGDPPGDPARRAGDAPAEQVATRETPGVLVAQQGPGVPNTQPPPPTPAPGTPPPPGQTELNRSAASIRTSVEKLDKTLANLEQITDKINTGQGTIGHLVNDDKLGKNLDKASGALNDLFGAVQQLKVELGERSEFLIGRPSPSRNGATTLANYSYNPWTKSYFSIRIIPKPDKWYGFEIVDDPRGLTKTVQVQNRFPDPNTVNQFFPANYQQITTERVLKFSVYLAKRYGIVSGRFGILENTGGFGVRFHLFNDSLTLSTDAFDFANPLKDHPRIKIYADYHFLDHILVTAGADDIVNTPIQDPVDRTRIISGRDYFVGAGFYFTDDDIKLLFSAIPIRF